MTTYLSTFFFFNDTATTEIYTLSLHALFRSRARRRGADPAGLRRDRRDRPRRAQDPRKRGLPGMRIDVFTLFPAWFEWFRDRKSTRLNSSHANISYAVFCLKKKKQLSATNYT